MSIVETARGFLDWAIGIPPKPVLLVRRAVWQDATDVAGLAETVRRRKDAILLGDQVLALAQDCHAARHTAVWVVEAIESRRPVGLLLAAHCRALLTIAELLVHPDWRGLRVGSNLLAQAISFATHGDRQVFAVVRHQDTQGLAWLCGTAGFRPHVLPDGRPLIYPEWVDGSDGICLEWSHNTARVRIAT